MYRYWKWIFAVTATVVLALAYTWVRHHRADAQASAGTGEVRIAINPYAGCALLTIASEKSYFADHGVNVSLRSFPTGKAGLEKLLTGEIDFVGVSDIPVMFAALDGQPVSVVATIFRAGNDHGLIVRNDRGVKTVADLKGKRIGVTPGTSAHFFLNLILKRNGVDIGDVILREVSPANMANAITEGSLDAVVVWEPYLSAAQSAAGVRAKRFGSSGVYEISFNLVTTKAFLAAHPDAVKRVLQGLLDAQAFAAREPDAARAVVVKTLNGSDVDLKRDWPGYTFELTLDERLLTGMREEAHWARQHGLARKLPEPDLSQHVYPDALRAVRPQAVTLKR